MLLALADTEVPDVFLDIAWYDDLLRSKHAPSRANLAMTGKIIININL